MSIMNNRIVKVRFLIGIFVLFFTACDKENEVDKTSFFEEPIPIVIYGDDNDLAIEKLECRVGYYYGSKPQVNRLEWTCRASGQYCIVPLTLRRAKELETLAIEAPTMVERMGEAYFLIKKSRSFITSEDFVSDMYFSGYYEGKPEYTEIVPVIGVSVKNAKYKEKLLNKYSGILYESNKYNKESNILYFDCKVNNSEQLLKITDEIYRLNFVNWAESDKYSPSHFG